jgi:hypothetical protein
LIADYSPKDGERKDDAFATDPEADEIREGGGLELVEGGGAESEAASFKARPLRLASEKSELKVE